MSFPLLQVLQAVEAEEATHPQLVEEEQVAERMVVLGVQVVQVGEAEEGREGVLWGPEERCYFSRPSCLLSFYKQKNEIEN